MTVKEMREKLIKICLNVPAKNCCTSACPIIESCEACSSFTPEDAPDDEIKAIYEDAVKRGTIKEE